SFFTSETSRLSAPTKRRCAGRSGRRCCTNWDTTLGSVKTNYAACEDPGGASWACTSDDSVVEAQGQHVPLEHEPCKAQAGEGDQCVPNLAPKPAVRVRPHLYAVIQGHQGTKQADEAQQLHSAHPGIERVG